MKREPAPLTRSEDDRRLLAAWAADCAERVLHFFGDRHPSDQRPRAAIEAARAWARGKIRIGEAKKAALQAHAAARMAAADAAAQAAARACGHAAATAHMAGHARHCAMYAINAVLLGSADNEVAEQERVWQYEHVPRSLLGFVYPEAPEKRIGGRQLHAHPG